MDLKQVPSAQNETDQLFNFSGGSPPLLSCNHQPVLCLGLSGQGEIAGEQVFSGWTLHQK